MRWIQPGVWRVKVSQPRSPAACRQIYGEPCLIPYSTKTVSFRTPGVLQEIIPHLKRTRQTGHVAMRSLHPDKVTLLPFELGDWSRALKYITRRFKNVQYIRINVEWCCRAWIIQYLEIPGLEELDIPCSRVDLSAVFVLKTLLFRSAVLTISDSCLTYIMSLEKTNRDE